MHQVKFNIRMCTIIDYEFNNRFIFCCIKSKYLIDLRQTAFIKTLGSNCQAKMMFKSKRDDILLQSPVFQLKIQGNLEFLIILIPGSLDCWIKESCKPDFKDYS